MARSFLRFVIVSVSITAFIAVFTVLFGDWGELETQIFMTSLIVSATSSGMLACLPAFQRGLLHPIPVISVLGSLLAGLGFLTEVWTAEFIGWEWMRVPLTGLTIGVSGAYMSLMVLATLPPAKRWIRGLVHVCAWPLTLLPLAALWLDNVSIGPVLGRILVAMSVVLAALSVAVPVLHRLHLRAARRRHGL